MEAKWKLDKKKRKIKYYNATLIKCEEHPLLSGFGKATIKQNPALLNNFTFQEPLNSLLDGYDPLTGPLISNGNCSSVNYSNKESFLKKSSDVNNGKETLPPPLFVAWDEFKSSRLSKFHTKQKLTLASSFLSFSETGVVKVQNNIPDRTKVSNQTGAERVKSRLEQLDSLDENSDSSLREMDGLTQEQFTQHLMALKKEMEQAWQMEYKIKALKITVQCTKCLALSSPGMFYPYKFMIVSEILDCLGSLVYKRLTQLLKSSNSPLRNSSFEAAETARNWFSKISSLRDLLPRIYLEAALIHCYSILKPEEGKRVLDRLVLMCRGVADPIVAAYVRMYIVKSGLHIYDAGLTYVKVSIEDMLQSSIWGWNGKGVPISYENEKVFGPPFFWMLRCYAATASFEQLFVVAKLGHNVQDLFMYLFAKSLMETYPQDFLAVKSPLICTYLHHSVESGENSHEALIELANILNKHPPPEEFNIKILNVVWKLVTDYDSIDVYLKAATPWVQYSALYFMVSELDKILSDVLKRLTKFSSMDPSSFYPSLLQLVNATITFCENTSRLFELSSFQGLLSIFQREAISGVGRGSGVTEMKKLLESLLANHSQQFTNPTVISLFLLLFSSLHDSLNALTTDDEKRQISQLVNDFIRQVNYGRDFELQLEFYVDARAAFSSLDSVLENLIQHVCRLQIATMQIVKGKHTSKTASFERACCAYCFITIPSLSSPTSRLKLYLLCGSIAMINSCMGQGDACIRSGVKEILEICSLLSTENNKTSTRTGIATDDIASVISYISSYLIALPDPPDAPAPLYLYRGLSKGIKSLKFIDPISYCHVNLAVIKGISTVIQNKLPYNFKGVDGNDILYGGDCRLLEEAQLICTELLMEILFHLKKNRAASENAEKGFVCDLIETIFNFTDLGSKKMQSLLSGLILLCSKYKGNVKGDYERRLQDILQSL